MELRFGVTPLGDACDTTPCPQLGLETGVIESDSPVPPFEVVSNSRLYGYGVAQRPPAEEPDTRGHLETGFRFCPCDEANRDSVEARVACA